MKKQNATRAKRAARALASVKAYAPGTRDGLVDLLTDLMHYADREGLDFEHAASIATTHHAAEIRGEE